MYLLLCTSLWVFKSGIKGVNIQKIGCSVLRKLHAYMLYAVFCHTNILQNVRFLQQAAEDSGPLGYDAVLLGEWS
jgi:hypothetical protein